MNTDSKPISPSILLEGDLTDKILGAAFKALNRLGAGFLEKVYENALSIELRKAGLLVERQKPSAFIRVRPRFQRIWTAY